jgi:glucokinase
MTGHLAIGIDIGGTKISAALVDADGALRGPLLRTPTPRESADAVLEATIELARRADPDQTASAAGVGSAGAFDLAGKVTSATAILPGWTETDVAGTLRSALGIPTIALNDAHAAALGEMAVGAGRGISELLVVVIGTGIGGAAITGGRLHRGPSGLAGSIGHMPVAEAEGMPCSCGATGHLEAIASGPALEAAYASRTGRIVPLTDLPDEPVSTAILGAAASAIASACAAAAAILDPQLVLIGGGVAELGARLLDPIRQHYVSAAFPPFSRVPIARTSLGALAANVGAGVAALNLAPQG